MLILMVYWTKKRASEMRESPLRHQLNDLLDFDTVFDDVMKFLGGVVWKR